MTESAAATRQGTSPSPASAARERRIGLACALAVLAIWSGFALSSRLSASQAFTPWDVAALRYCGSFLVGLALAAGFGWPRLPWRQAAPLVASAGLGFPLSAYLGFAAAPTAHGTVLMTGLLPFVTAGLAWLLLGERWSWRRLVALLVVGCGMALLALDSFARYPGAWKGDLWFLLACLSWAAFTLGLRRWRVPAVTATTALALYPPLLFLPLWPLLPSSMAQASWGAMAYQLVYQGCFAMAAAGFLFSRAVNAIGPVQTTSITALTPVLAALAAWPLLGEPLGLLGLPGVALVSAGMLLGVLWVRG